MHSVTHIAEGMKSDGFLGQSVFTFLRFLPARMESARRIKTFINIVFRVCFLFDGYSTSIKIYFQA